MSSDAAPLNGHSHAPSEVIDLDTSERVAAARAAAPEPGEINEEALARFDAKLEDMARKQREHTSKKNMWLAHHWAEDYDERCIKVGSRHVCRRCSALYGVGFIVAFAAAIASWHWPLSWDPLAIWLLCIPATVAYCGEAAGLFRYSSKWQTIAMVITAFGFGRGLGYELVNRWSSEFWGPVAVFGGLWFMFTMIGVTRKRVASTKANAAVLGAVAKQLLEHMESEQPPGDDETGLVD